METRQRELLQRAIDRWDATSPLGFIAIDKVAEEVAALAQVVLEVVVTRTTTEPDHVTYHVDYNAPPLDSYPIPSLLDQLIECADEALKLASSNAAPNFDKSEYRRHYARALVLDLLSVLDTDPGHDATAGVVPVCSDRTGAVDGFRKIIQAIRRGE